MYWTASCAMLQHLPFWALDELLNLPVPWFLHVQNGNHNSIWSKIKWDNTNKVPLQGLFIANTR